MSTEGFKMKGIAAWFENLGESTADQLAVVIAYLPYLFGALLLLLVGWLMARLARIGALKLGDAVNRLLGHFLSVERLAHVRMTPRGIRLLGDVTYWLIIFFFLTGATKIAQLDAFYSWLQKILAYLPTLIAGGLIVFAGYLVSGLVRDLVSAAVEAAGVKQSRMFGVIAQGIVFLTALVIGIGQIGIDVTFLVTIIAIALAAVLAAFSLAFGLGARTLVSNLIGANYLQQHLRRGQVVRIGDIEGEILDMTPVNVVIAGPAGRTVIPAKVFHEQVTVLVTPEDDDE
jgi:small-conductance mechanosensitive channel